jgi:hypothetical protein
MPSLVTVGKPGDLIDKRSKRFQPWPHVRFARFLDHFDSRQYVEYPNVFPPTVPNHAIGRTHDVLVRIIKTIKNAQLRQIDPPFRPVAKLSDVF